MSHQMMLGKIGFCGSQYVFGCELLHFSGPSLLSFAALTPSLDQFLHDCLLLNKNLGTNAFILCVGLQVAKNPIKHFPLNATGIPFQSQMEHAGIYCLGVTLRTLHAGLTHAATMFI